MRVSKHIIQTSGAYIFCNEGVRICILPVTIMDSKQRKDYLRKNKKNVKSFNISNDFIGLSFIYSITNFLITCYVSVSVQTVTRCRQRAFLSAFCLVRVIFIFYSYYLIATMLTIMGCDVSTSLPLGVSMVSLFPSSYDK